MLIFMFMFLIRTKMTVYEYFLTGVQSLENSGGNMVSGPACTPLHCKKSYRQIPTYKPDDARPNDQADGICLQQACRTFPIDFNTKVRLFWQVPSPKSDFSNKFRHLSRTFPTVPSPKSDFSDIFHLSWTFPKGYNTTRTFPIISNIKDAFTAWFQLLSDFSARFKNKREYLSYNVLHSNMFSFILMWLHYPIPPAIYFLHKLNTSDWNIYEQITSKNSSFYNKVISTS